MGEVQPAVPTEQTTTPLKFRFRAGSWHGAWCFAPIIAELHALGHDAKAIEVPNVPGTDFDKKAKAFADALTAAGDTDVIGVFHCRSGNEAPRAAQYVGSSVLKGIVYVASSLEPSTLRGALSEDEIARLPTRSSTGFRKYIRDTSDGLTIFDPKRAHEFLYHDCPDYLVPWAIDHLEPQPRFDQGPRNTDWPDDRRQLYVMCEDDRIIRSTWVEAVTDQLGIERRGFPSGHSPFLADPKGMASMLINWANDERSEQPLALPRQLAREPLLTQQQPLAPA